MPRYTRSRTAGSVAGLRQEASRRLRVRGCRSSALSADRAMPGAISAPERPFVRATDVAKREWSRDVTR